MDFLLPHWTYILKLFRNIFLIRLSTSVFAMELTSTYRFSVCVQLSCNSFAMLDELFLKQNYLNFLSASEAPLDQLDCIILGSCERFLSTRTDLNIVCSFSFSIWFPQNGSSSHTYMYRIEAMLEIQRHSDQFPCSRTTVLKVFVNVSWSQDWLVWILFLLSFHMISVERALFP